MRRAIHTCVVVFGALFLPTNADSQSAAPVTQSPAPAAMIPPNCQGDHLDLANVLDDASCEVHGDEQPLPANVVAEIEPNPIVARSGASARAAIAIRNTGTETAVLQVRVTCGTHEQIRTSIYDASNRQVDITGAECGSLTGCGSSTVRFALRAGGVARLPFTVSTRTKRRDDQCRLHPGPPLPRGRYELRATVMFLPAGTNRYGGRTSPTITGVLSVE